MTSSSEQRAALRAVTNGAERKLAAAWRRLDPADVSAMIDGLNDLLPAVGDEFGGASAALAADYYEDVRLARGARGRHVVGVAAPVGLARWRALAAWGTKPLYGSTPNAAAALTLIQGGLQRSVANQYRDTIRENSVRDKAAVGWQRVGAPRCDFCRMLISRGAVYTEATADFDSHDHCGCSAEPVFRT